MKQEYQDFIEKLFEVIKPINKNLLDKCEIYDDSDRLGLVWRGEYLSIVIYYYSNEFEYKFIVNGVSDSYIDLWLNINNEKNWDTLKYYFTQLNLLENITVDSLNEYTINVLANNYKESFGGAYDDGFTGYKDALTFISKLNNNNKL